MQQRELIAAPTDACYAFIGDCQARAFGDLLFHDEARAAHVLCKNRWRAFFRCSDLFRDARFDALVTRWLWELRAIRHAKNDAPSPLFAPFEYRLTDGSTTQYGLVPNVEAQQTLIVACGEVDAWDLWNELGAEGVPAERIEQARLEAMIEYRTGALFEGLRALRDAGLPRLVLLGLVPPTVELREQWPPVDLRYAIHRTFTTVLARSAERAGVAHLPLWDAFLLEGRRDERYFHDAVHLNTAGATRVVQLLHERGER